MEDLIASVTTIIQSFLTWFTTVSADLIKNPVIALMFGLGIAMLIYRLVVTLVGKASFRAQKRRR